MSPSTAPIDSAVSSVQPPAQTDSRASSVRSGSASRSWLQAIVSRRVRCRSGASASPAQIQRPVQPAQQHRRRQRAHPGGDQLDGERQSLQPPDHVGERRGVLLGDGEGGIGALGPATMNSWTAAAAVTCSSARSPGSGTASGPSGTSCSPRSRSRLRLVTSSWVAGQRDSRTPRSVAPRARARRCPAPAAPGGRPAGRRPARAAAGGPRR